MAGPAFDHTTGTNCTTSTYSNDNLTPSAPNTNALAVHHRSRPRSCKHLHGCAHSGRTDNNTYDEHGLWQCPLLTSFINSIRAPTPHSTPNLLQPPESASAAAAEPTPTASAETSMKPLHSISSSSSHSILPRVAASHSHFASGRFGGPRFGGARFGGLRRRTDRSGPGDRRLTQHASARHASAVPASAVRRSYLQFEVFNISH